MRKHLLYVSSFPLKKARLGKCSPEMGVAENLLILCARPRTSVSRGDGGVVFRKNSKLLIILRHLAGILGGTTSLLLPVSLPLLRAKRSNFNALQRRLTSAQANSKSTSLQSAVTRPSTYPIQLTNCSAARTGQSVYFSQEPVFAQLPRGPPTPACESCKPPLCGGPLRKVLQIKG